MASAAFITGVDVGAPRPPASVSPRSPARQSDGEDSPRDAFNPTAFDFDAVFHPAGPTDVPLSVPLRTFIAETEPLFGETKDELLKHAWSQCFVESPEVEDMCKDLFWWVLRKVVEANALGKDTLEGGVSGDRQQQSPSNRAGESGLFGTSMLHEDEDAMREPASPALGDSEDGSSMYGMIDEDTEDLAWIRSLDRANKMAKLEAEGSLAAALREQEARKARPAPRTEDLILDRLSENYMSVFRKTMFNIESFCAADNQTDAFDDGLLPQAVRQGAKFRAMSFRARLTCDRILGALPDAFAQATVRAVHRAAPRVVDSFGIERLRMCTSDIMNVCINGMRETKTRTDHWPAIGLNAILGAAAQPARVKLPLTGIKKSTLGLHKELSKLSKKLDRGVSKNGRKETETDLEKSSGGARQIPRHNSTSQIPSSSASTSGATNSRRGSPTGSDGGGSGVEVGGPTAKMGSSGATERHNLVHHDDRTESMPLEQRHIVTKTRFVLGNSHFIGKLVEKNNRASSLRKHELMITLTTSSARPDLVPSLSSNNSTFGDKTRTGKDLFGWVAEETMSRKNDLPVGLSEGTGDSNSEDANDDSPVQKGPITVSMALAASRKRAQSILRKSKQAKIRARRAVQKIRRKQKIDLDGIAKEARRTRYGDSVNELANNLANLSSNPNKK